MSSDKQSNDRSEALIITNEIINELDKLKEAAKIDNTFSSLLQSCTQTARLIANLLESTGGLEGLFENYDHLKKTFDRFSRVLQRYSDQEIETTTHRIENLIKKLRAFDLFNNYKDNIDFVNEYRADEISKKISLLQGKAQNASNLVEKVEELTKEPLENANRILEETEGRLKEKEERLNEIFGRVTADSISGSYEQTAYSEGIIADKLRGYSLTIMIIMALLIVYNYYEASFKTFEIAESIFRIGMVIILSIPATYLAKESSKHRNTQNMYQQSSLHLKAIHPYIASLPEPIQNEIKAKIAEQIFSNDYRNHDNAGKNTDQTANLLFKLLEKLQKEKFPIRSSNRKNALYRYPTPEGLKFQPLGFLA